MQGAAGVPEDVLHGFRKVQEEAAEEAGTEKVLVTEDQINSLAPARLCTWCSPRTCCPARSSSRPAPSSRS